MDSIEQAKYSDVICLVNRTDKPLEFMFDSRTFVVNPGKGLKIPRFIAQYGLAKYHTKADPATGLPSESLLGIEDDPSWPTDKIKNADVQETLESDKLGQGDTLLGPPRKMKRVALKGGVKEVGE